MKMDFRCSNYRKNFASCRNKCFYFFRNNVRDIEVCFSITHSEMKKYPNFKKKIFPVMDGSAFPELKNTKYYHPVVTW